MEALAFLEGHKRMCHSYSNCDGCPLKHKPCLASNWMKLDADKVFSMVKAVEMWSKANPIVTNEMKFRELFGDNAVNSILALHPSDIKRWLAEPYKERES